MTRPIVNRPSSFRLSREGSLFFSALPASFAALLLWFGFFGVVSAGVVRAQEPTGEETTASPAPTEIEALPAVVKLRTAALLLSDQQGGELAMVSSVVRRPGDKKSVDALLTVEIDDSSLRQALPEGGAVEGFVYLVDRRLEIFDSVSVAWTLPGPPDRPGVEKPGGIEPTVPSDGSEASAAGAPAPSPEAEPTTGPEDPMADGSTEEASPEVQFADSESEDSASKDLGTGLDPIRFTAVFPAPAAGDYVFRILFRAGEHFGLRSVPLSIPAANDSVASMLEPILEVPPPENDRWLRVSPAGRGTTADHLQPGLSILRPGTQVPLTFARSSKSDVGEVRLELARDGEARVVPVTGSRSANGLFHGQVDLPADLEVGQYQLRLLADSARPSLTTDVLVLDDSLPAIRWTELDRLASHETTFSGEALRMPASERQRVIATRRELFQVVVDMEEGVETALARFRALEQSLDEQLGTDTIPFLETQLSKVVTRLMRKTRKQPELTMGLAWLFMEHAEQHRRGGSYRFSRLGQDMSLEILRKLGEDSKSKTLAAEAMAILGGWLQRQRFLDPAEAVLKEALALEPEAPYALSSLAAIYERYDRVKDAAEVLEKLVEVEPDRPLARVRLAVALHRLGELERASKELDRVLQAAQPSGAGEPASTPWWLALAHQEKVRLAVDRGQIQQAQQALNEGLKVLPEDPVLRFAQPWLLSLKGQPDSARQGLLELASSPDGENARNRFHAWPRAHLDALSRKMRQTTRAASPELAALARTALEKTQ